MMGVQEGLLYGLSYESDLPLPGLPTVQPLPIPDVTVRLGALPSAAEPQPAAGRAFYCTEDTVWLHPPAGVRLRIERGEQIVVEADPSTFAVVRLTLLNVAFGLLLLQRRRLVLHAASFVVDGQGVAVVAGSGLGKSVVALAMARRGHTVLTDEVCGLAQGDDPARQVSAGPRCIQVWPDVLEHLELPCSDAAAVRPGLSKQYVNLAEPPDGAPRLRHVFVLERDHVARPIVEPLDRKRTLGALLQHTHLLPYLPDMNLLPFQMQQCTRLSARVLGYRLARPRRRGFDTLDALCENIEQVVTR